MSDKLRECPFCGEMPQMNMVKIVGRFGDSTKYTYECSNCGLLMIEWDKDKLIKTWNTRNQPKHETIEQWEERTGKTYPDDGPVWAWFQGDCYSFDQWMLIPYKEAYGNVEDIDKHIIVATHQGKPND